MGRSAVSAALAVCLALPGAARAEAWRELRALAGPATFPETPAPAAVPASSGTALGGYVRKLIALDVLKRDQVERRLLAYQHWTGSFIGAACTSMPDEQKKRMMLDALCLADEELKKSSTLMSFLPAPLKPSFDPQALLRELLALVKKGELMQAAVVALDVQAYLRDVRDEVNRR